MNAQDFRSLQEAYMEVVEGKVSWDDKKNPNPSGYTPKEKSQAKRKQLGVDNPDTSSFEKGGPGENEYARHANLSAAQEKMSKRGQQPKGKPHQFKKNPFWKKNVGQVRRTIFGTEVPKDKKSSYPSSVPTAKEELDIYDIILSHLLDEGYAETPEQAEAIMVNMGEDWRDSIVEEFVELDEEKKKYPYAKVANQKRRLERTDFKKGDYSLEKSTNLHGRHERLRGLPYHKLGDPEHRLQNSEKTKKQKKPNQFGNRLMRSDGQGIRDSYDYYDIILSHLLDEGYAETPEQAEAIMVNMGEDWREDIMEGMTMKDFKANRIKIKRKEASTDAKKRGHVGKEWYNSGKKYSPDEAKRMRSGLDDGERSTRHRSAVDPEGDDSNYSANRTKNPNKLRKQKAMGEH